jgi:preprotein translocase subunit SecD
LLVVSVAVAFFTGCGGGRHAGVRIYDSSGRVKAVVSGNDFVPSSARALKLGGSWAVTVSLTREGRAHFLALTSALAHRSHRLGHPQHMAIALDGKVESTPYIDYRNMPRGSDGREGLEFANFDRADAEQLEKAIRGQ